MRPPLAIELFCGTFGWSHGWLEMGGRAIGFDLEHLPHHGPVPAGANLILQDVHTIDGRRLKEADLILASPPCPEFSYMAMPWTRAKQIAAALRGHGDFPEGYRGSRTVSELTALFDACFRIQREASEAAGRYIPMVVENVKGAQPWVGQARYLYGSFALWGDVPALMPKPVKASKVPGFRFDGSGGSFQTASVNESGVKVSGMGAGWRPPGHPDHRPGLSFNTAAERATKNEGGSWFNIGSPGQKVTGQNPVYRQIAEDSGVKVSTGIGWFGDGNKAGHGRNTSSKSSARKAASARIARIPERLSRYIANFYFPAERAA